MTHVKTGTHNELVALGGSYAELVKQQTFLDQDEANVEVPSSLLIPVKEAIDKVEGLLSKRLTGSETGGEIDVTNINTEEVKELATSLQQAVKLMKKERERLSMMERKYQTSISDLYGWKKGKDHRDRDHDHDHDEEKGKYLKPKVKREWEKLKTGVNALRFVSKLRSSLH